MKKCNTELMKELKAIQSDIADLTTQASQKKEVAYYEGEKVERDFDYQTFVSTLDLFQEEERKIKSALAYSNATTKLVGMEEYSISEGLVKLAQLNNKLRTLATFKAVKQVEKTTKYASFEGDVNRVHVVERLYDVKKVDEDIKSLQREISRLQVAIDRTNLTNMIDY